MRHRKCEPLSGNTSRTLISDPETIHGFYPRAFRGGRNFGRSRFWHRRRGIARGGLLQGQAAHASGQLRPGRLDRCRGPRVRAPYRALLDGQPGVVIQNIEGAAGLVGAKYVGEIAPRDGTLAGYLTGTAFLYALDPELFRVDFKTYEFVGIQPGTSINFVRTDVAPGMKAPADFMQARGVVLGSLATVSSKGVRLRLGLDMLGIPFKYISGYRSGGAAKLAIERGEINFYGESSPSYFCIIEPGLVKSGSRDPGLLRPRSRRSQFHRARIEAKGVPVPPLPRVLPGHEGRHPSGPLWEAYKSLVAVDGNMLRLIVLPPGTPPAAVTALREALIRLDSDKATRRMRKAFGFVPLWQSAPTTMRRRSVR